MIGGSLVSACVSYGVSASRSTLPGMVEKTAGYPIE